MANITFQVHLPNGKHATKTRENLTHIPKIKDLVTFHTLAGKVTFSVYRVEHIYYAFHEEVWVTMDEPTPTKNLQDMLEKAEWEISNAPN